MGVGSERNGMAPPSELQLCQEPTFPGSNNRDDYLHGAVANARDDESVDAKDKYHDI
jgi:hypothetical protein